MIEALDTAVCKTYAAGTHRVIAPEETVRRARELMPALGITRVANVTGLDRIGIPVVMVTRPNSRSLSVSQGKGTDLESARASGLMESIEMFHSERADLPLRRASWEEMRDSAPTVDVWGLARTPASLFHPRRPLLWVEGDDLLARAPKWVPFDTVDTNFDPEVRRAPAAFVSSSNGLASGNHVMEAISHGICEVIERDAGTLFGVSSRPAKAERRVDQETVDAPLCCSVLDAYARAGVGVSIWDITSDVGVPAFRCAISELAINIARPLPSAGGFGCHPTRHIALLRALTEAAQSRLTMIAGARDDMFREAYELAYRGDTLLRTRQMVTAERGSRSFHAAPSFESDSLSQDVAWMLDRLRRAGIREVVVVDLSKPEFDLPVVKVVIPGLEFVDNFSHRGARYQYGERAKRAIREREEEQQADAVLRLLADPLYSAPNAETPTGSTQLGKGERNAQRAVRPAPVVRPEPDQRASSPVASQRSTSTADVYVFLGPTLSPEEAREALDAVYLPPVSQGDIYRVAGLRPRAIGIIDGYFERVPAVWHKEILWAMSRGIHVFGSSSMGALRAAELAVFGMEGVGRIYEAYRDEVLEDDDEVAVIHGPEEVGYRPLSDAMVDIRYTLERAVAEGVISATERTQLETIAKGQHYADRTYAAMLGAARASCGHQASFNRLESWLPEGRMRQKRIDALALLHQIRRKLEAGLEPKRVAFSLQLTTTSERARTQAGEMVEGAAVGERTRAILEELWLMPAEFEHVRMAALARRHLLAEAEKVGLTPDDDATEQQRERLRVSRGLQSQEQLDEWWGAQELTPERLQSLLTNNAIIERMQRTREYGRLEGVVDYLQITGMYARLKARAEDKRERLEATGLLRAGPDTLNLSIPDLLRWYFEERLSWLVPRDLEAHARSVGFTESRELIGAILHEYCYAHLLAGRSVEEIVTGIAGDIVAN